MKKCFWLFLLIPFLTPLNVQAANTEAQQYDDMGMALYRQGLYAKAIPYFQNAVQADPSDWEGYENLGNAYFKINANAEALSAYQNSLKINPDNSTLENIVQTFRGNTTPVPDKSALNQSAIAPVPPAKTFTPVPIKPSTSSVESDEPISNNTQIQPPPASNETVVVQHHRRYMDHFEQTYNDNLNPIDHSKFWSKFELGYNFSAQPDLNNSAAAINTQSANGTLFSDPNWSGTSTMSSNGYVAGGEFGLLLDPYNGIAIGFRFIQSTNFVFNTINNAPASFGSNPHDFENGSFSPYVVPITLDYYIFMPDHDGRFFFSLGGGYYAASVDVSEAYNFDNFNQGTGYLGTPIGTLTAGGFGVEASIGREFAVDRHFGIEVFARGRYAKISGLQGTLSDGFSYGLDKFSDGTVDINAGGSGTATLDFSGFDVGLAFNWYSF